MEIIADLHIHTSACPHGHSTLEEIICFAKQQKLYGIGISEHVQGFPDGISMEYLENAATDYRKIEDIKIFHGAETDVFNFDGRIWLQHRYMRTLDYLIASAHKTSLERADVSTVTHMWMKIAQNPDVDIIGHCGRDNDRFPFEYEPVIRAFAQTGKIVEINTATLSKPEQCSCCRRIVELCGKYKVPMIVGTDSHFASGVGKFDAARELLEEVGISEDQVVNSSIERLNSWITVSSRKHHKS